MHLCFPLLRLLGTGMLGLFWLWCKNFYFCQDGISPIFPMWHQPRYLRHLHTASSCQIVFLLASWTCWLTQPSGIWRVVAYLPLWTVSLLSFWNVLSCWLRTHFLFTSRPRKVSTFVLVFPLLECFVFSYCITASMRFFHSFVYSFIGQKKLIYLCTVGFFFTHTTNQLSIHPKILYVDKTRLIDKKKEIAI